jgi:DNA polymerase III delta prime subunit
MAKFGKKNKVSLNPLDANICLLGLPKIGKTTIMKEVAEKLVGEDGYLFLEMYRENGAKYIEDIVYEDVPDWDTFVEIIDDIVDNRTTDYADLKVVIIDTLDNALQLAEQESVRLWNKENPQKRTTAINAAWGGFMKGQDKAMELLQEQMFRLRTVGVAFSVIGHVKQSTVTDPITNETYQQITSDVSNRYFNQLKKNIDLVGIAYIDRELVKNKVNGKEVSTVKSETRKIKFRDDNYTVDSGSRMSQIVNEINFDADEFIKAMTDALEAEVRKGGKSVETRKKENEKEEAENMKRLAEAEAKAEVEKALEEVKDKIVEFCSANTKNREAIKPVMDMCKEHGYGNPKEIDDLDVANKVLAICK